MKGRITLRTVFRSNYSTYEGEAPRLYRTTEEIRRDIKDIKARIAEANAMLNVRNMLTEVIAEYAEASPERWVPELRALVEDAEETLAGLGGLCESLDMLKCELEDTRWAIGV